MGVDRVNLEKRMLRLNWVRAAKRRHSAIRGVEACVCGLLLFLVWQQSAMAQANVQGQWTSLTVQMPINPVHLAMMRNGKVLVVSGSDILDINLNYMTG